MTPERLQAALNKARAALLAERTPEGYWVGELSPSALSTATAISALCLAAEAEDGAVIRGGLQWLARTQLPDGSWGDTPDSPGNLSTTLLCLCAWRIAVVQRPECLPAEGAACSQAAEAHVKSFPGAAEGGIAGVVRGIYGADSTFAVPILMNCALAGIVRWNDVPALPFELSVFPRELYRLLKLQVVSYALPALIAVGLVIHRHRSGFSPAVPLRNAVTAPALRLLRRIQPDSGGYLEAAPLTSFVLMSLAGCGDVAPAVRQACLEFLRGQARADGSWPIDANLSAWLTSSALNALKAAGDGGEDLESARRWLAARQTTQVHPFTGAAPGGWGWSHLSGSVPDADDTSGALLALAETSHADGAAAGAQWLLELQNADGGWPTFCRGWGKLPFDQSCPDITAHALRALTAVRAEGLPGGAAAVRRGMAYLHRTQRPDGSWVPLWFGNQYVPGKLNPVLGTARVLMALKSLEPAGEAARRAVEYLTAAQHPDGGWGGAPGVEVTVEETALAVSALSGIGPAEATARGTEWLVRRIDDDKFHKSSPIGLYFSRLWYFERLYPLIWTVEALGFVS
jgi:squalene-hopene/tetraprenyl-beta-curcumene cyclase